MKIIDQIGAVLEFKDIPKRIVSLVPSQTELLVDLGLEKNIVGITKFCIHPSNLKEGKTIVGGTKNINIDKIKALKPDIILCNKEENTKEIVDICKNIAITHVSDIYTIKDVFEIVNQYGNIFNCNAKSLELENNLKEKLNNFHQFIKDKQTIRVAYFIWKNPWIVAANTTFINHLLQLNNFVNVYSNKERYPEVDILKLKNLDAILLSSEPFPFKEIHIKELEVNFPKTKILLVDGEMFSWYGSRLLKAFDYFKELQKLLVTSAFI